MDTPPAVDLRSTLITTSAIGWSGQLVVRDAEHGQGLVVMRSGRVAWAVSKAQVETLGDFLWRLGHVSKSDLQEVKARFKELGGQRKFGSLLEEANLVPRPVLRRCLLLHTRTAVHSMLNLPAVELQATEGELTVDEDFTFSIEEILTDYVDITAREFLSDRRIDPSRYNCWHEENEALSVVSDLPGYTCSALISASGEVLAAHAFETGVNHPELAVQVAALFEAAGQLARTSRLVTADSLVLRGAAGGMHCQWLGAERRSLIVVCVGKDGEVSAVERRMRFCLASLQSAAERILLERGETTSPDS